jgi:glyoxylase-like metal-dependent hydrolase (beta-lactamase superfamily II)
LTRIDVPEHDIVGIRAANPGPFTLTGTNSWIVGREPGWLVDPGPALPDHTAALEEELIRRGGLGGLALTHDHADHSEASVAVRERFPDAPAAAARGPVDVVLEDGSTFGPLEAVSIPGHASDHVAFIAGTAGLTGDAVLGEGSVFVAGQMADYLAGLERLRCRSLQVLLPGHGPLISDPRQKLGEYIDHRLDRERRLTRALDAGMRRVDELLDEVWDDAPVYLRPAAALTLGAHLDKLADEGRLPPGVERPEVPWPAGFEP